MKLRNKIKLFLIYKNTLKENLDKIKAEFINKKNLPYIIKDIKYDKLYRIYTVINFTTDTQGTIKNYGYRYMDEQVKSFVKSLDTEFKKYGISEFIKLTNAEQIGKSNILIEIEYKFLNLRKIIKKGIFALIIILIGLIFKTFL